MGEVFDDLEERGGLYYKKFSEVKFTGKITKDVVGNASLVASVENGKIEGPWIEYYFNGQLEKKGNYKNGKKVGAWVEYYWDGQFDTHPVF